VLRSTEALWDVRDLAGEIVTPERAMADGSPLSGHDQA
jgi:hypothetical protein